VLWVTAAVPQETGYVRRGPQLQVVHTGVGFTRARAAARDLVSRLAPGDFVLSTGFCGALDPALAPGQMVLWECAWVEGEPEEVPLETAAPFLHPAGIDLCRTRGVTVPRIVNAAGEREELRSRAKAEVVDMESGILARACRDAGVPCAVARVVLDTPADPLRTDYGSIPAPTGDLRGRDVVRWLCLRPWRLGGLLADRRAAAQVAGRLGEYVNRVAEAHARRMD